jgi:hypothetical protein
MGKDMAMVHKAWELHEMLLGNVEKGIGLHRRVVFCRCPSNSQHEDCELGDEGSVFPPLLVLLDIASSILAEILILGVEGAAWDREGSISVTRGH